MTNRGEDEKWLNEQIIQVVTEIFLHETSTGIPVFFPYYFVGPKTDRSVMDQPPLRIALSGWNKSLLVPFNLDATHWLLCHFMKETGTVIVFDSMVHERYEYERLITPVTDYFKNHARIIPNFEPPKKWKVQIKRVGHQDNGADCKVARSPGRQVARLGPGRKVARSQGADMSDDQREDLKKKAKERLRLCFEKKTAEMKEQYEEYIKQNPGSEFGIILESDQDVEEQVQVCLHNGKQIFDEIKEGIMSLYIWETGGDPSSNGIEPYAFLSREASPLYWRNGMNITKKDMMDIGFKVITLYQSTLKINARKVEAELQCMYHYLAYGHNRLWKEIDRGAKFDQDFEEKRMYYSGITYHPDLEPLITKGIVIVNDKNRKNGHGMTFSSESKNDVRKEALDLLDKEKVRKQSGNGKRRVVK